MRTVPVFAIFSKTCAHVVCLHKMIGNLSEMYVHYIYIYIEYILVRILEVEIPNNKAIKI